MDAVVSSFSTFPSFSSFFDNCCCAFALLFGSFHTAAHVGLLLKAKRNLLDVVVSPDACVGDVAGPNIDPAPERKTSRRPRVIRSGRQSIMQDPMHTHTHTYSTIFHYCYEKPPHPCSGEEYINLILLNCVSFCICVWIYLFVFCFFFFLIRPVIVKKKIFLKAHAHTGSPAFKANASNCVCSLSLIFYFLQTAIALNVLLSCTNVFSLSEHADLFHPFTPPFPNRITLSWR